MGIPLRQPRFVNSLQLGQARFIVVRERPCRATKQMRSLAIRNLFRTQWQGLLACEPGQSEPSAHQRSSRKGQIELDAARTIELVQHRRDPQKPALVQCQAGTCQRRGKTLPEIPGKDRIAVMPDVNKCEELELVEVFGLPD